MATPQLTDAPDNQGVKPGTGLRGNLGVFSIVFMVAAASSPLGCVGGPIPVGIGIGDGTGFPATFLICGVILLFWAIGYSAMTPHVRTAGAFYSYIQRGFGRGSGVGAGFMALLSYVTMEAGVYGLIGPGINSLLVGYGLPSISPWIYAVIVFLIVAVLSYRNISLSGRILAIGLVAEVVITLVFDFAVTFTGGHGLSTGIVSPHQILSGQPGLGILFAILCFLGFESATAYRNEARNASKTIARATTGALILLALFYAFSGWAVVSAYGDSAALSVAASNSGAMLSDAAHTYIGTAGEDVINVLYVTSLFACILSLHNVVARYGHVLSGQGHLPARLGATHRKHQSPHFASLATSAVIGVLLIIAIAVHLSPIDQYYTWLGGFASVGIVVLYAASGAAVINFFRRNPELRSGAWASFIAPSIGLLGLLGLIYLVFKNLAYLVGGSDPVAIGILVLLALAFLAGPVVARRRPVAAEV